MAATNGLTGRIERLERHAPAVPCTTCGAGVDTPTVAIGGDVPPAWAEDGRCCACGRLARWYVGIDLEGV